MNKLAAILFIFLGLCCCGVALLCGLASHMHSTGSNAMYNAVSVVIGLLGLGFFIFAYNLFKSG